MSHYRHATPSYAMIIAIIGLLIPAIARHAASTPPPHAAAADAAIIVIYATR
jgi:hypothetical protein